MPTAVLTVAQIATLFHFSEWSVYEGVKAKTFPVPHLKLGARKIVFPVGPVAAALGLGVQEVLELVAGDGDGHAEAAS